MNKSIKAVLVGTTCSGKTSVGKILKEKYNFPVTEVDWEAYKIDPNIFKERNADFITSVFEDINDKVLKMDGVFFITSFLESKRLKEFHTNGYKIIHLYADLDELIKRRTIRHNGVLSEKRLENTKNNYKQHMALLNDEETKPLIDVSINTTNLTIEEITNKVLEIF